MPNREKHLFFGFIAFIFLFYIFNISFGIKNVDGIALLSIFIGSIVPDRIEPVTQEKQWRHRDKFHSKRVRLYMGIISIGVILVLFTPLLNAITFFCLGYFLHLQADSMTFMGLPE